MAWQKIVQREGDFLKNSLLYEGLKEHLPSLIQESELCLLTVRKGEQFIHYVEEASSARLSLLLNRQDDSFLKECVKKGHSCFEELLQYCRALPPPPLTNKELASILLEYFRLYKKPYPYFTLSIFADNLDEEMVKEFSILRLNGRNAFNKAHQLIALHLHQAANCLSLSIGELKRLTSGEILDALLLQEKGRRRESCYFLYENGSLQMKEGDFSVEEIHSPRLKGHGTFPGTYQGKVRVVSNAEELASLERGEIAVLRMATPDLPLHHLRRAAAFITDEGGITCHASVISREFSIPALMGTGNATTLLKNGELIEVNTSHGIVRRVE